MDRQMPYYKLPNPCYLMTIPIEGSYNPIKGQVYNSCYNTLPYTHQHLR